MALVYKITDMKGFPLKQEHQYSPGYLSDCENIYLSDTGFFQSEKFTRTFGTINEAAQIFDTKAEPLVCIDDTVYSYFNDVLSSKVTGFTVGTRWSCADFGLFSVLTNGQVNIKRNIATGAYTVDSTPILPVCNAICAHRGRLIGCGSVNYTSASWLNITAGNFVLPGDADEKLYNNFVIWSKINDLVFQKSGTPDRTNLSGYMPVEYSGKTLRVEPLQDKVIVYGDNGVSALFLAGTGYGQKLIHDTGMFGQYSACVNKRGDTHYFVDKNKELCAINADATVTKIGYRQLFDSQSTAPKMSYNPIRDEVFINFNDGYTYVLGKNGLTKITGNIQDCAEISGTLLIHSAAAITQTDSLWISNILNMEVPCQKYLHGLYARVISSVDVTVTFYYRKNSTDSWSETDPITFDKDTGYCNSGRISGSEFKVEFKAASFGASDTGITFSVDNIELVYEKLGGR